MKTLISITIDKEIHEKLKKIDVNKSQLINKLLKNYLIENTGNIIKKIRQIEKIDKIKQEGEIQKHLIQALKAQNEDLDKTKRILDYVCQKYNLRRSDAVKKMEYGVQANKSTPKRLHFKKGDDNQRNKKQ